LGTEQPVFAVQTLEQDYAALATVNYEQLIDFYVRLIRETQPSGPYRLAGWCLSAWIAYGVARRLEQMGQKIELIMIIDAWAPGYWSRQLPLRRRLMLTVYHFQRFRRAGSRSRNIGETKASPFLQRSLQALTIAVGKLGGRLQRWATPAESRTTEEEQLALHLQKTARLASASGPLQGKALLFRSEEEPMGPLLASDMGWSELFGKNVEVEVVPGDHHEIFKLPGAKAMAVRARAALGIGAGSSMKNVVATAANGVGENDRRRSGPGEVR
jgi:thioesterase domain-containing protein